MNNLVVDGHPDLYRDPASGAIVNKNSSEYDSYIKTYKSRMTEKQRILNMETDLNELKSEIGEIKTLLQNLIIK